MLSAARALGSLAHVHPAVRARAHLFALDAQVLPVDHDINRVVSRLMGMPQNRNRGKARRWLSARLAPDMAAFREAVVYLRHHALHTCLRVGPHCAVCPLRDRCPHASLEKRPDA
jgi:endonuclease-3